MGLFSDKCRHCGSKEHASDDCPHGIFSSKCRHCGSIEHASDDCPHGIFSDKCRHCGSKNHASDDCPHGIFSSKCRHCGSIEHNSDDCPHGIFSSECRYCGSKNHASDDCPQGIFSSKSKSTTPSHSSSDDGVSATLSLIKWGVILAVTIFVLIVAALLAPVLLLIWYVVKKRENSWIALGGILAAAYLTFDIKTGGFLSVQVLDLQYSGEERFYSLGYVAILAITLGLWLDKIISTKIPVSSDGNFFSRKSSKVRRYYVAGICFSIVGIFSMVEFVDFSRIKVPSHSEKKSTERVLVGEKEVSSHTHENPSENKDYVVTDNSKEIQNIAPQSDNSKGEPAVISDADGFTNLREGKGTSYSVIRKIYTNEKIEAYPSDDKWWKVKTSDGVIGYMYHDRIDLLNKRFFIINVIATNTETQALLEVRKLKEKGYEAGHLWIPNYRSLSGAQLYAIYIGPFSSQAKCEREVERYRNVDPNAYGLLVSQENIRIEIRGVDKVKTTYDYHTIDLDGKFPQASVRSLNDQELKVLSPDDLRIMRNEIFARYGHAFIKGGEMESYFKNQKWYIDKNIDATRLLTDLEKDNIKLVKRYE